MEDLLLELCKYGKITFEGETMDYTLNTEGREKSNYLGCTAIIGKDTIEGFILKCAGIFFWGTSILLDNAK